jgi:uncharacterized protein (TIGR02147 family)
VKAALPDLYGYHDYRAWLRDVYAAKKAEGRGFSYRAFSRRVGLASPNHLKRVIDGERSLGIDMTPRYAAALGLSDDETRHLAELVAFCDARTDAERNEAYERLKSSRGYRRAHRLTAAHAAYASQWYLPAIRELVRVDGFRPDPAWIAAHLLPPVTVAEATEALAVLRALGMLVETGEGGLAQADPVVTTGPETRGLHVRNIHRAFLGQAATALERVPAAERDISALTLVADDATLLEIKRRLQQLRRELLELVADRPGTRVVQLNLQLFPVSVPDGGAP